MTKPSAPTAAASAAPTNFYPPWSPRFWHGMRLGIWLKLLAANRFRVHPLRWGLAGTITAATSFNSVLHLFEQVIYGRRVRRTVVQHAPLFILGHWRSGTTLLHELLVLDEQFACPTTYQCFVPSHFLVSEAVLTRLLWLLLPAQRPMDNMVMGWNHPQEDEFALCNLGAPSPYTRMAFPNHKPPALNYLDMAGLSALELKRWQEQLDGFVRKLTVRSGGKRLVLKSPPHTGRVATLENLYPGAKFIHLTRHPDTLFASTLRLWRSLDDVQGLQRPREDDLEEFVFTCFERMYAGFESQRAALPAESILDLRYEDLVANPEARVSEVYERLALGNFQQVQPKIAAYQARQKNYKTNRFELEPRLKAEIRRRWAGYFTRYGYATD